MQSSLHRPTLRTLSPIFFVFALSISTASVAHAHSLAVQGVVSASSLPVRFAAVTFVNNADTTDQVTIQTDTLGRYALSLTTSAPAPVLQPAKFELEQNYPNPFSSVTAIPYKLASRCNVQVTIYDILGREIRVFDVGVQEAGVHGVRWDGRNQFGSDVAAGIYFYRLKVGDKELVKKMVFGLGDRTMVPNLSVAFLPQISGTKKTNSGALHAGQYTIRVRSNDVTFPAVVAQDFNNVVLFTDTTLNLTVSTNGTFPDPSAAIIYPDTLQQVITGFGGMNNPGWGVTMSSTDVQTAFGAGQGQLGLTIMRIRIPYDANQFSLEPPTALQAASLGAKVFASPWTPPAWMKTSNNIVGGTLNDTSYASFASHLKSFADYMSTNGVPLYAISVQNEPDISVTYESCDWNGPKMVRFLRDFAPAIGLRMIAPESFNFNHTISDSIFKDPGATSILSIVGGHIYGSGIAPYPLAVSKGKELWMTEHLDLDTSWTGNLGTGTEIHNVLNAGMHAYIWWYIRRYYGPIRDNGTVSKRGYVISQFARFVRPGYVKVKNKAALIRTVAVSAYRSGSKIVMVIINTGANPADQVLTIWNGGTGTFTPYVTSSTKSCQQHSDVSYKNGVLTVTLDASSITTLVSK